MLYQNSEFSTQNFTITVNLFIVVGDYSIFKIIFQNSLHRWKLPLLRVVKNIKENIASLKRVVTERDVI